MLVDSNYSQGGCFMVAVGPFLILGPLNRVLVGPRSHRIQEMEHILHNGITFQADTYSREN